MAETLPLQGLTIVNARPKHQASGLTQRLMRSGGAVIEYPLIATVDVSDADRWDHRALILSNYDLLIFTSVNAVQYASRSVFWSSLQAASLSIAAVGKKTADALQVLGLTIDVVPEKDFNSEALLACEELLSVAGLKVAILRGEGGRELLKTTLVQRGACVDYINVYRRVCPQTSLLPLVNFQNDVLPDIILLTSVESLQHFFRLGDGLRWVEQVTILAGSTRIAEQVRLYRESGQVIVSPDPSDEHMVECLVGWASQ